MRIAILGLQAMVDVAFGTSPAPISLLVPPVTAMDMVIMESDQPAFKLGLDRATIVVPVVVEAFCPPRRASCVFRARPPQLVGLASSAERLHAAL